MSYAIFKLPKGVALDTSANVQPGAKLHFYLTGTTTPVDTYTTSALNVAHPNPVVADIAGVIPVIYLDPSVAYKVTYTTFDDVLVYTADPVNDDLTLTQDEIGGILYPINDIETAASISESDLDLTYSYGVAQRYGMVADWDGITGTDNNAAFRRLTAYLAAGGPFADLGNGRYKIVVAGGASNLSNIDDRDGVTIYSDGAELHFQGSYTGSQFVEVFSFTDCNSVALVGSLRATQRPLASSGAAANNGIELFKFWDGCTNVRTGPIYADGVRSVVSWRRNLTSDPKGSGGFHELINAVDCGYGLNNILSGDNITANIVTLRAVRSYYPYGIANHTIDVNSQDHWGNADANISSAGGEGCSGITLNYTNLNSTVADNSINCVKVSFTDQTPAIHRNIHCTLNISAATSADYLGFSFVLEKLNNAGSADTVDRGHILDGLTIDHTLNAKNGSHRSISVGQIGTWSTGEFIRNFKITRLRSDGGGQPNILLTSLADVASIDNVYSSAQVNLTGSTAGRINVSSANVSAWSVGGGRCYLLDDTESTVTYSASMTLDSFIARRFVITATNGSAFTINAPSNPASGKRISITLRNTSGGALGAATWNSAFKMASWTNPATGNSRTIDFMYDGTNWIELSRTPADVPN